MKQAMQFALRLYKRLISPMLPHSCRFVPTCSEYAMEAVERHGALRGSLLAVARLLRCHPFARSGYDPVPLSVDAKQVAKSDSARATRPGSLEVV
jgi:putative membrane protein insertion efficiency factor